MMARAERRGFTLLEMMIATLLLAFGMVATFALLERVEGANRAHDLTRTAHEVFTRLAAQIRDAQCDYDGSVVPGAIDPLTTDPGLLTEGRWIGVESPVDPFSSITAAGVTTGADPRLPRTVPPVRIEYRVETPAGPEPAPALDVDVRVRMLTGRADMDDPAVDQGWWIKRYAVKKTCNARYERTRRGEYR